MVLNRFIQAVDDQSVIGRTPGTKNLVLGRQTLLAKTTAYIQNHDKF